MAGRLKLKEIWKISGSSEFDDSRYPIFREAGIDYPDLIHFLHMALKFHQWLLNDIVKKQNPLKTCLIVFSEETDYKNFQNWN